MCWGYLVFIANLLNLVSVFFLMDFAVSVVEEDQSNGHDAHDKAHQ
jgi:hypothetical protein